MIPNKYPGKCANCGYEVAAGKGFYYPENGRVEHSPNKCPDLVKVGVMVPEDRRDEIIDTAIRMRGSTKYPQRKYPFHKMADAGDWFEWPVADGENIQEVVQRLRVAAGKQAARHGGRYRVTRNDDQTHAIVTRVEEVD